MPTILVLHKPRLILSNQPDLDVDFHNLFNSPPRRAALNGHIRLHFLFEHATQLLFFVYNKHKSSTYRLRVNRVLVSCLHRDRASSIRPNSFSINLQLSEDQRLRALIFRSAVIVLKLAPISWYYKRLTRVPETNYYSIVLFHMSTIV